MKRSHWLGIVALSLTLALSVLALGTPVAQGAYHHMGESDSPNFVAVHPDRAGTKLDSCNLCHSGGSTQSGGKTASVGSCQWCHQSYGYDGKGDIKSTLNSYGTAYLAYGRSAEAIAAMAGLDSDGDGYTNGEEIAATRYPGDPKDDPTKVPAPYRVLSRDDLEKMPQHSQFLLMNASKSTDTYSEYSGVALEELLGKMVLPSAKSITVFSPDGFAQYHPLNPEPDSYQVYGTYPQQTFHYDDAADIDKHPRDGWVDYGAATARGLKDGTSIDSPDGLKLLLAFKRDGKNLDPGVLNAQNKLDGEGPFRVVPPQLVPGVADQRSTAADQKVGWPYDAKADHNAGFSTRSTTIIRVDPLPAGTTDIDTLEAGWSYVDEGKILIYGAIDPIPTIVEKLDGMAAQLKALDGSAFNGGTSRETIVSRIEAIEAMASAGDLAGARQRLLEDVLGRMVSKTGGSASYLADADAQKRLYWDASDIAGLLRIALE